jgi:hypothetical protein
MLSGDQVLPWVGGSPARTGRVKEEKIVVGIFSIPFKNNRQSDGYQPEVRNQSQTDLRRILDRVFPGFAGSNADNF